MKSSNYIDYKATIWCRVHLDDEEDFDEIINRLSGPYPHHPYDASDDPVDFEFLVDSEEYLSPEENQNQTTIEVYKDNTLIWQNCNE